MVIPPNVAACYREGLLDGAALAEWDQTNHFACDARITDLTENAKQYGATAQKGLQAHRAYRALLLGTARGYRQTIG